jgi:adenylosuccinate synthase
MDMKASKGRNVVVVGTQWGDEGKGKLVDWLTEIGARCRAFSGWPQCRAHPGHQRCQDRAAPDTQRHHARRSPVLHRQRGGVVRRQAVRGDRGSLEKRVGVEVRARACASARRVPLILPVHVALDVAREAAREKGRPHAKHRNHRARHRTCVRGQDCTPCVARAGPEIPAAIRGQAARAAGSCTTTC